MSTIQLKQLLFRLGQTSFLSDIDSQTESFCSNLEKDLQKLDMKTVEKQIILARQNGGQFLSHSPLKTYLTKAQDPSVAQSLLRQGKVATIILAGGQGSRFGQNCPKGLYPLSLIKQKSLLQLFLEKSLACAKSYGAHPHVAIMTSESTHDEIQKQLLKSSYFGLPSSNIDLFKQSELALLSTHGDLIVNDQGMLLTGPDGNGSLFWNFSKSGILQKWKEKGIEYISVVLIDNALLDPFPLNMLAEHAKNQMQITCGAVLREDPEERVGIFVLQNNKIGVVEYSEMSTQDAESVDQKGNLHYALANLSYFIFSLSFAEKAAQITQLPLHKATKKATADQLQFLKRHDPFQLYKFEYFIFDLLEYSEKTQVFLLDRSQYFAPLKNGSGKDSVTSVQKALLERDRMQYEWVSGVTVPKDRLFELSMSFYYPNAQLIQAFRGKPLPNSAFIEGNL